MKTNLMPSIAVGTVILITAALSEPPPALDAVDKRESQVRAILQREVVAKLDHRIVRFSRVAPSRSRLHRIELDPRQLVGAEECWPFRVLKGQPAEPELQMVWLRGYLRLSDDEVFIFDPHAKRYLAAAEHPQLKGIRAGLFPRPDGLPSATNDPGKQEGTAEKPM